MLKKDFDVDECEDNEGAKKDQDSGSRGEVIDAKTEGQRAHR